MANDVVKGVKDWWLGSVEEHTDNQELAEQFKTGQAPDAADLIRFDDGQTELDTEFRNIYATNRAEDPLVESYFTARDAFEQHEGIWNKIKTRIPYYVPIVSWLPKYKWKDDAVSDLVAGVGVAAMLIPQSLAYALLAGVEPQYGLYTAFFPLIIYTFMGTSKQLSIGPDALSSLLVGLILPEIKASSSQVFPVLAFMTGIILLVLGLLRVGFLDNVLSKPLLCGFVNAVAVTILMEQVDTMFGLPNRGQHGWRKLVTWWHDKADINWVTFGLGLIFMAILFLNRWLKSKWRPFKYVPETLVVVIVGILIMKFSSFEKQNVKLLGKLTSGFEVPEAPALSLMSTGTGESIFGAAMLISVIGFIEHIVIAKLYAAKYNYPISPNRELVALGISNSVSSFFKTYPTFGSLPRSAVADGLGAKSQLFAAVTVVVMFFTIMFMGPLFYHLPRVAMGAIIVVASIGLFEFEDIEFLWGIRAWKELFLMAVTFGLTIALGLELGIFISLGISVFFIIKTTTYPHVTILGHKPDTDTFTEIAAVDSTILPGIIIVRIEDPLYFANIAQIKALFSRIERLGDPKAHPALARSASLKPTEAIIIHSRNILTMDASAIQVLHEMMHDYDQRGVLVVFVKLRENLIEPFLRAGILEGTPDTCKRLFSNLGEAVTYIKHELGQDNPDALPGVIPPRKHRHDDSEVHIR